MEASLKIHDLEPGQDGLRDEMMGFLQTIEMIRPSAVQMTFHKKPDGRVIAKSTGLPRATEPMTGFAFENWFWHLASMPGCFSVIACLLMASELLAPI